MAQTMRAWQYADYEGTLEDNITFQDVHYPETSSLKQDEVIVEILHAALNPVDYKLPESGVTGRLMISKPATAGLDFSGRIIAKHASCTEFEVGQLVFGGLPHIGPRGTLAQQVVVSVQHCASVPDGVGIREAAAVGTAATTAFQSLLRGQDLESFKSGATVFIDGGSGGVGTFAVQFAKALGACVVATCSTSNVEFCKQLGADEVIDYKQQDILSILEEKGAVFDLLIDNVGNKAELYKQSHKYLKSTGTFVQVGVGETMTLLGTASLLARQIWPTMVTGRKYYFVNMKNSCEFFSQIGKWMAQGKVKSIIDSSYSFGEVPAAYRKLRAGHTRGKVLIDVSAKR